MKTVTRTEFATDSLIATPADIAIAIKAARTQSNLRIVDAALLSGVAVQTFVDIEAGSSGVSIGKILQVATAVGVSFLAVSAIDRDHIRQQIALANDAK